LKRRSPARAGRPLGILLATTSACILPSPSFDEYGGGQTESSSAASAAQTSEPSTAGSTAGSTEGELTTSDTDASSSAGPTSTAAPTSSTSTGEPTTGGDDTYPVDSCAELQAYLQENGQAAPSGVYTINLPNSQTPVEVYCDLEIADGGWLLVGRSVALQDSGNFGWRSGTGKLSDDDAAYSLNLQVNPFPFDQLLIGTWSEGKQWGENVYQYEVPPDLTAHEEDLVPTTFLGTVSGDCKPDTGPAMLTYTGATAKTSAFFFRDVDDIDDANYGLLHDMLWTFYTDPPDDCPLGGMLAQKQGMIMVRESPP